MLKAIQILGLLVTTVISFNSFASSWAPSGSNWYGPYTISKVTTYIKDSYRTMIHVEETPNTTCSTTNRKKMATLSNSSSSRTQPIFSAASSAQAQQKKVMLLLGGSCNASLGLSIYGVEILSE
ncbi:hypothetical protein VHP8226_00282 [Vibrio hippocampi]|uniref:Uncharacterized protein n=1 Tax=Vibrio hippocampi TaxID=654686 RepID=A0ABN8DCL7_9VIBR|nr:hypothetical protein VHP8226_00282 [Vibrio hippocampi]